MPKFPEPPTVNQLQRIPAVTHTLPAFTVVSRIFYTGEDFPATWDIFRHYGPTASRFDHHLLNAKGDAYVQDRGIMYLAAGPKSIPTCLAEVFQVARTIDRFSRNPILCGFELAKPICLLDIRGPFATALGVSTAIHSGPRPRARRWAQQLYLAYPDIDGLFYCSSMHANEPAIALFERGSGAIPGRPIFHRELKDPVLAHILTATAQLIRYVLI